MYARFKFYTVFSDHIAALKFHNCSQHLIVTIFNFETPNKEIMRKILIGYSY